MGRVADSQLLHQFEMNKNPTLGTLVLKSTRNLLTTKKILSLIGIAVVISTILIHVSDHFEFLDNKSAGFYTLSLVGTIAYGGILSIIAKTRVDDEEIPYQDLTIPVLYMIIYSVIIGYYFLGWWMLGNYGSKLPCFHQYKCDFKEAIYFTVTTSTTVGYGDFYPQTDAARIFSTSQSLISAIHAIVTISLLLVKRRTS